MFGVKNGSMTGQPGGPCYRFIWIPDSDFPALYTIIQVLFQLNRKPINPNTVKSPLIIFTLKFSIILYFAACSGIGENTKTVSATPHVTKGIWKINVFKEAGKDISNELTGYTLTFIPSGKIIAVRNGELIRGNWSEDEILKRITINLETKDPFLTKLNDRWNVSSATDNGVTLQNTKNPSNDRLQITSL
jgi:hypothetical protein